MKPQRHKETNVFKFKSFADRIQHIDLRHNALYHIQHVNEEQPEENETHFRVAYGKWIVLNLTDEYNVFQRKIRDIVTLPQLVHKKDYVVRLLLEALESATTLSLQPLLEFVVVLAKDLREEFYPYFQSFLDRLILLLRTQDADQLEWTLVCLAYLFKTLKPFLKKDISVVFNAIMPLLDRRNPEHITNFAAESFSFVSRDIKDKEKFLGLVLAGLKRYKNGVNGCGRLLFEISRGVAGNLHSCAHDFLGILFRALRKTDEFDQELLFEVMTELVLNLCHTTNPPNMQTFWDVALSVLGEQLIEEEIADSTVQKVLQLMGQAVEFRRGKMMCGADATITSLMQVVDAEVSEETLHIAAQMAAAMLLCPNLTISQLDASRLTKKILSIPSRSIFESFVWNVVKYSQFELLVLPEFLKYFEKNTNDPEVLELLCKIVLEKSPPSRDGITLPNWNMFGLRFKQEATFKSLEHIIVQGDVEHPEHLLMSLVVYPHVVGAQVQNIEKSVVSLIQSVCSSLKVSSEIDQLSRNKTLLFVLSSLVECTLHIGKSEWLDRDVIIQHLLPFCKQNSSVLALNTLDQLISTASDVFITFENFRLIYETIVQNLSSEYHRMRLLTAHILLRFGKLDELGQSTFDQSIYDIFFYVESITAGIHTYRDQLMSLQKLSTDMALFEAIQSTVYSVDPLRYLLGALYINFNLLWKPVTAIIVTYSQALSLPQFWSIFQSCLESVTATIRHPAASAAPSDGFATLNVCLLDQFCSAWECTDRPDHTTYRIHLWRALPELGTLSEIKNRDVVTLLFDFIELEYKKSYENDALCWNLAKRGEDGEAMEIDPEMEEEELNETQKGKSKKEGGTLHKGTQRTLIAIISVFAKLANPSQIHRQPDVYALLLELLCHRNPAIQKLALDCIMSYKHKYLVPYKDHLYGIIEESKFKESITAFKIEGEENVVQPEHRVDLMPILLRILYSKMVAKVQKGGGQARKALVMRFLGSCQEVEVLQLLKMAFAVYEPNLRDDPLELVQGISKTLRLEAILSPKKLQSSLNLVEIIREQFGGLMGPGFLKYLLSILYSVGAMVEGVLARSEEIHSGHMKLFKNLRALCLQNLANFFNHFDTYPWEERQVDTMWTLFVTPTLSKLPQDGIHSATPLLKLLTVFSKNPRYFVFLVKLPIGSDGSADETPLRYCIDLLLEPKTKPLVCLAVMEIIQSLLQLSDVEPDESGVFAVPPIGLTNVKQPIRPDTLEHINFGSAILLPHLHKILEKFQLNLQKRRGLTKRDLHIVSRCTELVMDSKTSSALLELLLPILVRKSHGNAGEDALAQMVSTIKNLFEKIEEPEQHIRSIAPMFEQITAVGPRKLLCDLVETIAKRAVPERRPALKRMSDIVKAMNAWDRRWVEQPDYEKRLTAFKTIGDLQASGQLDMDLGLMTIYHSFYFVKHDKDLAMRDSASFHLKSVVPALAKQFASDPRELEYLVGNVILNLIRRTINDKNDAVRTEGIQLLGEMARECPEAHVVLQDLQLLTNKTDREVDFFDNITHMQNHRHIRAFGRFCSVAKTVEKVPNSRTLTQFILPLATQYVCVEKHSTNHGLVTAAIETIGVVCHFLPWHQYESILKYYLKKMRYKVEYQKQLVRLVMQVLDAFHFDLSNAKMAKQELAKKFVKEVESAVQEAELRPEAVVEEVPVVAGEEGEEEVVLGDSGDVQPDDELDVELNKTQPDEEEMEVAEEEDEAGPAPAKKVRVCVFGKTAVLTHKAAKRLVHTIATGLIPQLNNSITVISTYESFHKLNKKKRRSEREEEEILRVPIALAMVKLLQKLPDGMLDHTLPGILTKVCMFLKSPLRSVRMVTRDILKSIMQTVGNKYLDTVLQQLTSLLTRGFQVHVLTVTVHAILDAMKLTLKAGDIDRNMQSILAVILEDIFGKTAEEKEVRKIGMSTPEAKPSNKSFQSLHIIAINITESCLLDLLIPFKDKLTRTQSKTVVLKIQDCFQKIVAGLVLNKNISIESLLMFIYGTASESIPDLLPGVAKPILTESQKEKMRRARPDCFLIPEEPRGRTGAIKKVIKTNVRANAHVLVEFGLDMLHIILKRGKLLKIDYQPFIDPIIPVLLDSLKSTHIRVTTYALKCFASLWTREMRLPNLEQLVPSVVPQIFLILHKYATAGMSSANENFNLVKNAFKTMVSLMRCVDYFTISEDQLRTLLLYIEQNLYDATKQTIAFALLKVIVGRKLLVAEMHDVMRKISEIAVTSESSTSRSDAKSIMVNYLMDYPLGKKVDGFVKFFVANLNYEVAAGRESAIQVLHAIVKRFPPEVLNKKAGYLFLSLGARLVNDESADCRKLVAECVESLISKLDANNRNQLFDIILMLLADTKISHREMAALLCTRFIVAERGRFAERIEKVLPPLIATLSTSSYKGPGQFVRPPSQNQSALEDASEEDDDNEEEAERHHEQAQRAKDHQLIQALNTLLKIFETHSTVMEQQHHQYVDELAYESQKLLAYEHVWVRLNAAKALDIILSRLDVERVQQTLVAGRPSVRDEDGSDDSLVRMDFIYSNPRQQLKSLCLDLCAQLLPEVTDAEMAAQVTKNLLYVANLLKVVTLEKQEDINAEDPEEGVGEAKAINLLWLIRRMRYVVHAEVAKAPHSTVLRTAVFHWIEGLTQLVDESIVTKLAPTLLTPIVREMSEEDKNIDAKLRQLALKVGGTIRSKIGDDSYNLLRSQLQTKLMIKRAERKKLIAQVKVNDPTRAAMRKQGEQQRKKVAHKRKMDVLKGRALPKKKKVKRNVDVDDMF